MSDIKTFITRELHDVEFLPYFDPGLWKKVILESDYNATIAEHVKAMDSATETMKMMEEKIKDLRIIIEVVEKNRDILCVENSELSRKLEICKSALEFVYKNYLDIPVDNPNKKGVLTTGRIIARQALEEIK